MIGVKAKAAFERTRRQSSKPSIPGITTSRMIRSGASMKIDSRARVESET